MKMQEGRTRKMTMERGDEDADVRKEHKTKEREKRKGMNNGRKRTSWG